jgi:DNA-binding NarL/FixJ family response regulator
VIILSLSDERTALDAVMAAKVEGFVLKRRAVIDLIPAIREILQGRGGPSGSFSKASGSGWTMPMSIGMNHPGVRSMTFG